MNKLSKQRKTDRDDICSRLRSAADDLQTAVDAYNTMRDESFSALATAIETYNDGMTDAWAKLDEAQSAYNEVISDAREWKSQIASEIDEYMGERSEKWQESDKASTYSGWKDSFEEDLEQSEIEEPEPIAVEESEEISIDLVDAAETLEQLPEEVDA